MSSVRFMSAAALLCSIAISATMVVPARGLAASEQDRIGPVEAAPQVGSAAPLQQPATPEPQPNIRGHLMGGGMGMGGMVVTQPLPRPQQEYRSSKPGREQHPEY